MKMNVATRVIGGFAIISALLLVLGFVSISSLNQVQDASNEVSQLALPTVSESSTLKASFLNMGRLSFEGFVSSDASQVTERYAGFKASKEVFDQSIQNLNEVVKTDPELSSSVSQISSQYAAYIESGQTMFDSHLASIEIENMLNDIIGTIEESADDASSLLLDFVDSDEVLESGTLEQASELVPSLESSLLSIIASASEFNSSETLQRVDLRKMELDVVLNQIETRFVDFSNATQGQDVTGTVDEVKELIETITSSVNGENGLIAAKTSQIEQQIAAQEALNQSDIKIGEALAELNNLSSLADKRAADIKNSVSDVISGNTFTTIGVVVFSLLLAAFISFKSVTAITRPLTSVNHLLKIASSGDLTHKLDDSSKDEFGELAANCNHLIANLKDLINVINQRADQLAAASTQTSTITLQSTASIEEQKSQISQIAAATTEMHTTSELVSQSADDTLKQIKEADSEAEIVKKISNENKSTIQVLASEVQQAAEVINKLHQDSASISGILDVIRGVADQTNLLALNAAIEAARAGEQGRGFAVVADEVRTLASRTQESTQEINSMIEVLQAGAEKAVLVMNQGKEQTNACVKQTEKAGHALNQITDAVHKAYEVSTRIEDAAKEQHTVSSQISERLENIVGIAEQTTVGAKQTSESSAEVARLAEALQESISQFRV